MPLLRRISDDEAPAVRDLLAARGTTRRSPESWNHDHMTALVLGDPGHLTAAMPLARRTLRTSLDSHGRPRELHAGWLSSNQFASRISLRRQTRSTAPRWPELLPDIDALVVLRRDEPSLAARWYAHTGFHDVLSIRCLYLDMESPPEGSRHVPAPGSPAMSHAASVGRYHVQVVSPEPSPSTSAEPSAWDPALWQSQMLSIYRDVYGSSGGMPLRSPDFWRTTLANHYYRAHYQFQIIGLWNTSPAPATQTPEAPQAHEALQAHGCHAVGAVGNVEAAATLMGYALVGWSGWHSKRPRMDILELATRQWDTAVAAELIATTCQLAWSKNVRQVRAVLSVHDPYRGHLTRTGFTDRWGYTMLATWLHPQRYLDRLAASLPEEIGDLHLRLSTPGQLPLTLRSPSHSTFPAPALHLQTDPRTLTRLLLNRTDIPAALRDGTLLAPTPLSENESTRLALAFPWTPWIFHLLDYI